MLLAISKTTILVILLVIVVVLLIGCAFVAYIWIGNRLFKTTFKRPKPMPVVDRSPNDIDTSDLFGKGKNWFYAHRMEYLNVRVDGFDGTKLAGYYRPARDRSCRNVVILLHGYNEMPSEMGAYAKLFMNKIECHMLIIHQRAHQMSEGRFVSYGLYESVDLMNWIDFAKRQVGDNARIFIMGRSMGATTALLAAQQEGFSENVAGIVADCPMANLSETLLAAAKRRYKMNLSMFMPHVNKCAQHNYKFDINHCETTMHADRIRVPVLIFQAVNDVTVSPDSARRIYDRLRCPKRMLMIDNCEHIDCYNVSPALYEREVENFIEKCVVRLVKLGRM